MTHQNSTQGTQPANGKGLEGGSPWERERSSDPSGSSQSFEARMGLSKTGAVPGKASLLCFLGLAHMWKKAYPFTEGEESKRAPEVKQYYSHICQVFTMLVERFGNEISEEKYKDKKVSKNFILIAIHSMKHTHNLIIQEFDSFLASTHSQDVGELETLLGTLKIFNDFLAITAKLEPAVVLTERQFRDLFQVVKLPFAFAEERAQKKLLGNLAQEGELVAKFVYLGLQTVCALSLLVEPEMVGRRPRDKSVSQETRTVIDEKYETIAACFKVAFTLLLQPSISRKIFYEPYLFEKDWIRDSTSGCKIKLKSFIKKRLSVLLSNEREEVKCSLKHVIICCNYKILKRIYKSRLFNKYDERIFNLFAELISKANLIPTQQEIRDETELAVLINENTCVIKSFILSLILAPAKVETSGAQGKREVVNAIAISSIRAVIKVYLHKYPIRSAGELTIEKPRDLLALIFKALLKFKEGTTEDVNGFVMELMAEHIASDYAICLSVYNIYLLQYVLISDAMLLKKNTVKNIAEMCSNSIESLEEAKGESTDLLSQLKTIIEEQELGIFLEFSKSHFDHAIEIIINSIKISFNNEPKFYHYLRVLLCLLAGSYIPSSTFSKTFSWNSETVEGLFKNKEDTREYKMFIEKGGMRTLFSSFKFTIVNLEGERQKLKQHNPQADNCSFLLDDAMESEVLESRKKVLKRSYKEILNDLACFIHSLHCVPYFAKHFLLHFDVESEFNDDVFTSRECALLMLRLVSLVHKVIDKSLLDAFTSFATALLKRFHPVFAKPSCKHEFLHEFLGLLEVLAAAPSSAALARLREAMLKEGLLGDFMHGFDENSAGVFSLLITLAKCLFEENTAVYSNADVSAQVKGFFEFLLNAVKNAKLLSIIEESPHTLLNICYNPGSTFNERKIIKDMRALEYYYTVIYRFLKYSLEKYEKTLSAYILSPLDRFLFSLYNTSVLAKSQIPHLLLRIVQVIGDQDILARLFHHLGIINSVHSTPKHIKKIMRCFYKYGSRESRKEGTKPCTFLESLSRMLCNSITGESIKDFFYFGAPNSFIAITSPIPWPYPGLCLIAYIRIDPSLSKSNSATQCLFTFANRTKQNVRFFSLMLRGTTIVFRVSGQRSELEVCFDEVKARENVWQRIVLRQAGKEIVLMLGEDAQEKTLNEVPIYAKEYNLITIGAEMSFANEQVRSYGSWFKGEMSLLCFIPIEKMNRDLLNQLSKEPDLLSCIDNEQYDNYFFKSPLTPAQEEIKNAIMAHNPFIVDPRKLCFVELSKGPVTLKGLQKTEVVHNRPGKEVFCNLGGLRVLFPLLIDCTSMKDP